MRRPLTLVALGLVALLLQGGIATHVPRAFVPDLEPPLPRIRRNLGL